MRHQHLQYRLGVGRIVFDLQARHAKLRVLGIGIDLHFWASFPRKNSGARTPKLLLFGSAAQQHWERQIVANKTRAMLIKLQPWCMARETWPHVLEITCPCSPKRACIANSLFSKFEDPVEYSTGLHVLRRETSSLWCKGTRAVRWELIFLQHYLAFLALQYLAATRVNWVVLVDKEKQ